MAKSAIAVSVPAKLLAAFVVDMRGE